jgi:hypothetical protein
MAEAEEKLEQLRKRDKSHQQHSLAMLIQDQQTLAQEITNSAEQNRKVFLDHIFIRS